MRRAMTWWRTLGGLLAACVLALLVVAPTVGMAACLCDDGATVVGVEAGMIGVQEVRGERQDHGAPCDAACCVGGHCHHAGAMIDAPVAATPTLAPVGANHAMTSAAAMASRAIPGPERPPRA